ncbi:HAEPLYID family protein [Sphingobacterium olei]|uniref:HAEPLYID family protein n=1 Tax=Sphingobacterium olei TaxID=2571155 RepID=UPI00192E3095|nr:HAEPLYID family protein [Sphingobacterium olei]
MKNDILFITMCLFTISTTAQQKEDNGKRDSVYIHEIEHDKLPVKVLHAEPLYIDLIRDLGARKGEKEWNIGLGLTDNNTYDEYTALIEYEWAPIDRLGLEIELPFSIYYPTSNDKVAPSSNLNSFKFAGQYSFYVSEKYQTSMAIGYIHELELTEFSKYGKESFLTGNVYNPFFIAARRLGSNFHTLLYTGPAFKHHFADQSINTSWQINSNIHYMMSGTRNFVGVEFNKEFNSGDFDMIVRPQMRVGIADNLIIGIVVGVPISRENERLSSFLRLIYEPKHKT